MILPAQFLDPSLRQEQTDFAARFETSGDCSHNPHLGAGLSISPRTAAGWRANGLTVVGNDAIIAFMKIVYRKYFSRSPAVCHGQLVYRGTRIPVSLTLQMLEGGDSIADILRGYPSLSRKSVQAALRAASETVENVR